MILNKDDYQTKIKDLLSDGSKFRKITKNPCEGIQKKVNNLIDQAMIQTGKSIPLKKVIGDYSPGYIYGNVKTHKEGEKLRPIISQLPTPTYDIAKGLDKIIKKYLPQGKMLKSSMEFVDLLNSNEFVGDLFSLDVESLFTNVPVKRTINIILEKVYNHPTIPAPVIPKEILEKLLLICTTEVPFRDMDGTMYVQCDGMSMGSPLGPTFANFFMAEVEERALSNTNRTPALYCRYIDDIFVICDLDTLEKLKDEMKTISGLDFTVEESVGSKLPFLNVMIEKTDRIIRTKVYRKPTDVQMCLNAEGECPDRYKQAVVKGYLYRAKDLCSEKSEMMIEISRSKQILINNGYSNRLVDREITVFLKKHFPSTAEMTPTTTATSSQTETAEATTTSPPPPPPPPPQPASITTTASTTTTTATAETSAAQQTVTFVPPTATGTVHKVFYQNFMNPNYKQDEQRLKKIIKDNVKTKNPRDKLQLVIYYRSRKTKDLIMRNNLTPKVRDLARTNMIYDFQCKIDECAHQNRSDGQYSGLTKCTLSRRLTYHLQVGAIKNHCLETHGRKITRKEIVEMTKARYYENDYRRLEILEALIIHFEDPVINRQDTGKKKVLKLYGTGKAQINQSITR